MKCPHCGSEDLDRGATGLDRCNRCDGLSRAGRRLGVPADHTEAVGRVAAALEEALEYLGEPVAVDGVYAGDNLPEILREALEELAHRHGGAVGLVAHRPGSWEAEHVLGLAGWDPA